MLIDNIVTSDVLCLQISNLSHLHLCANVFNVTKNFGFGFTDFKFTYTLFESAVFYYAFEVKVLQG